MSASKNKVYLVLFALMIWCFLNSGTIGGNLQYIVMILLCGYCLLNCDFKIRKGITINTYLICISVAQFLLPIYQYIVGGNKTVLIYSAVHIVYMLTILSSAEYVEKNDLINRIAGIFFALYFIYVLYCYIRTPTNLFDFSNIAAIVTNEDRTRNNYNGIHANNIGNMCAFLIMSGFIAKSGSDKKSYIRYIAYIFSVLMLISTGSRGGIVALLVFLLCYQGIKKLNGLFKAGTIHKMAIAGTLLLIVAGIVLILAFGFGDLIINMDYLDVLSSGRIYGWENCIRSLISSDRLIIGFDFVNPVMLFQSGMYGRLIADNWFVYVLLTTGIVGLVCMLVMIGSFGRSLVRNFDFSDTDIAILSFFVAKLFYGLFEISFYTLSDASSFLLFTLIIARVYKIRGR